MSTKMISVGSSAVMVNHQPKFLFARLVGALPCFTEQTRLFCSGKCVGLSDVNLGRLQPQSNSDNAVKHVCCRSNQQPDRMRVSFGQGNDLREQKSLFASRSRLLTFES